MLLARDARLVLGYGDLWRASRGEPLRIRELRAGRLDGRIERLADGRASWQFGKATDAPDTSAQPTGVPSFGVLQVDSGGVNFHDALMVVDLVGTFSLTDGSQASAAQASSAPASSAQASMRPSAPGAFRNARIGRPIGRLSTRRRDIRVARMGESFSSLKASGQEASAG